MVILAIWEVPVFVAMQPGSLLLSLKSILFAKTRKIFQKVHFLPLSLSTFWMESDGEGRGGWAGVCEIQPLSNLFNVDV